VIDVDDLQRQVLLELTEPLPESLGELSFILGMMVTDVVLDGLFTVWGWFND
jgi:hypothetical protein